MWKNARVDIKKYNVQYSFLRINCVFQFDPICVSLGVNRSIRRSANYRILNSSAIGSRARWILAWLLATRDIYRSRRKASRRSSVEHSIPHVISHVPARIRVNLSSGYIISVLLLHPPFSTSHPRHVISLYPSTSAPATNLPLFDLPSSLFSSLSLSFSLFLARRDLLVIQNLRTLVALPAYSHTRAFARRWNCFTFKSVLGGGIHRLQRSPRYVTARVAQLDTTAIAAASRVYFELGCYYEVRGLRVDRFVHSAVVHLWQFASLKRVRPAHYVLRCARASCHSKESILS